MTKEELKQLSDETFTSNNNKQITAANHRHFNNELIDNLTTQEEFEAYEIPDAAVTTTKLANECTTEEKLADKSVTINKLADGVNGTILSFFCTNTGEITMTFNPYNIHLRCDFDRPNATYDFEMDFTNTPYKGLDTPFTTMITMCARLDGPGGYTAIIAPFQTHKYFMITTYKTTSNIPDSTHEGLFVTITGTLTTS